MPSSILSLEKIDAKARDRDIGDYQTVVIGCDLVNLLALPSAAKSTFPSFQIGPYVRSTTRTHAVSQSHITPRSPESSAGKKEGDVRTDPRTARPHLLESP